MIGINYFGVPFKVNIETGEITKIEYQQKEMCFKYGYPKRQAIGAGQHKDPTANTAIGNLKRSQVESSVIEEIVDQIKKRESQRGNHGILIGATL